MAADVDYVAAFRNRAETLAAENYAAGRRDGERIGAENAVVSGQFRAFVFGVMAGSFVAAASITLAMSR